MVLVAFKIMTLKLHCAQLKMKAFFMRSTWCLTKYRKLSYQHVQCENKVNNFEKKDDVMNKWGAGVWPNYPKKLR